MRERTIRHATMVQTPDAGVVVFGVSRLALVWQVRLYKLLAEVRP